MLLLLKCLKFQNYNLYTVINITQQLISSKYNTLQHRFLEVLTLGMG